MRLPILAALGLAALALATPATAFEIEEHRSYPAANELGVFRIISTADLGIFDPILRAFQATQPNLTIEYTVTGTTDLMQAIEVEGAQFDLAISSAMDLQTKLANDGFAQTYDGASGLPTWANWRDQVFAFTQEPAVLVVSDAFFDAGEAPRNRDELIEVLRADPERFYGRVGTYDVRTSGFGYLMATQDSRNSDAFWRLMEVMGRLDAQLYCCSGEMIRDVASGKLGLAYNVLGSYAATEMTTTKGFYIIELDDYVNVMLRTSLIPKTAKNTQAAHAMIEFLSRLNQRPDLVEASGLPPIDTDALQANSSLRPIRFGPGLLVFMDQLKRRNFLRNWENSLVQDP
ncbi:MAG: ABC transporter substrate-binding protein [Loktanella sp.]|jgi:iron(III) transport system substrate-binding protein|nr:ABC transporter substrate-binding protein [Yoonia sp.]MDO7557532.1 ABC transporter substrate-binding protein [Loktanella sp.]MDO7607229.1 ABC transporter substrate-binding protein [Loktanella sp.]MDO7622611.1 ABC transporter substrate-binding protein [Loktanella sp.]MDO7626194.1 ABC transporter substrate-binding protein [Loktanella sp.]